MNRLLHRNPAQLAKILGDSVCNQTRVKIVLSGQGMGLGTGLGMDQEETLIGIPIFQDGLRIVTETGTVPIPMKRILDVQDV